MQGEFEGCENGDQQSVECQASRLVSEAKASNLLAFLFYKETFLLNFPLIWRVDLSTNDVD
jgi:hypothetical protein